MNMAISKAQMQYVYMAAIVLVVMYVVFNNQTVFDTVMPKTPLSHS